jgi:hypothetical protein
MNSGPFPLCASFKVRLKFSGTVQWPIKVDDNSRVHSGLLLYLTKRKNGVFAATHRKSLEMNRDVLDSLRQEATPYYINTKSRATKTYYEQAGDRLYAISSA